MFTHPYTLVLIKSLSTKYIKETGALLNLDTLKQIYLTILRKEIEDFVGFLKEITSTNTTEEHHDLHYYRGVPNELIIIGHLC